MRVDEVANAGLREPYTNAPFAWDATHMSVVFTARKTAPRPP